jgi:hypothetical protein
MDDDIEWLASLLNETANNVDDDDQYLSLEDLEDLEDLDI